MGDATVAGRLARHRIPGPVRVAVGAAIVLAIALLPPPFNVFARVRPASAASSAAMPMSCNGHWQLCSRTFDEVVLPATHNSMAAAEAGFQRPSQQFGIPRQLDDGIRMLLIDSHHWETKDDLARIEAKLSPEQRAKLEQSLSEPAETPQGVFLCHVLCGAGATPLEHALGDVRQFMESHPHEVVGLFFEDYVSGAETKAAFDAADLTPFVYEHPGDTPWPTLREMIETNHRLVVFSEHGGGNPAWYEPGWVNVQDTRYDVPAPEAFNCALNRGTSGRPLFLLNHWIAKGDPSPEDAARVNAYDFLLQRAERCETERRRVANFVAVNFYERGDLFRVVDRLNGLPESGN